MQLDVELSKNPWECFLDASCDSLDLISMFVKGQRAAFSLLIFLKMSFKVCVCGGDSKDPNIAVSNFPFSYIYIYIAIPFFSPVMLWIQSFVSFLSGVMEFFPLSITVLPNTVFLVIEAQKLKRKVLAVLSMVGHIQRKCWFAKKVTVVWNVSASELKQFCLVASFDYFSSLLSSGLCLPNAIIDALLN